MLKTGSVQELLERLRAAAATLGASTPHEAGGSGGGDDVLFQALSDVSRHYGLSFRPHAIRAGIALVSGRLPLEHLPQAASRAGLEAEVVRLQIASLAAGPFPLLLVHTDRSADIVWDYDTESGALLSAPGSPDARARIAPDELSRIWTGSAVRFKPAPRAEDRRGAEAIASSRPDWFLPAFRMSRRVYAEAITATLALNVLALAMPLFTMNVYDRVLPNAAAETLWALAIGVLLATGFDFLIKTLRGRFVDHAARRADVVLSSLIFSRVLGARLQGGAQSAGVRANTLREYETLREFYNSATLTTFGDLPFLALFVLMTWVVGGSLVLVLLVAIPVVLAIAWATQRHLVALSETSFRDAAQKSAVAVEALSTLETIKAARAESFVAAKWERAVADQVRSSTQIRHISNLGINAVHVSQSVAQVLMIVVGFYMVAAGTLITGADRGHDACRPRAAAARADRRNCRAPASGASVPSLTDGNRRGAAGAPGRRRADLRLPGWRRDRFRGCRVRLRSGWPTGAPRGELLDCTGRARRDRRADRNRQNHGPETGTRASSATVRPCAGRWHPHQSRRSLRPARPHRLRHAAGGPVSRNDPVEFGHDDAGRE